MKVIIEVTRQEFSLYPEYCLRSFTTTEPISVEEEVIFPIFIGKAVVVRCLML